MKIIVTAIALAFATSAAAQTAPAPAPHHPAADHAGHQAAPAQSHAGHAMQGGCCADRNGNGRMDCCENMAAGSGGCASHARPAAPQPQSHPQGHQNR